VSFGDYRSETLTTLAWQALERKDLATVIVYTNKCVSMYEKEASKMQASLKDYPSGDPKKIFSYWALNDVATSLLIQGEAYRKAGQKEKAKEAYGRVVKEFSFGQAYSPVSKTFWKPVLAAQDGLYMIEHDVDLDFGDMTSLAIVRQMWKANADGKLAEVIGYAMKLNSLYAEEAVRMQKSLNDFAAPPAENIHKYWALNDVATGMFILGEAYGKAGMKDEAIRAYSKVISDYGYAQCWDESGWFWKVAEGAQQRILDLQGIK
jgi:tetratricopeptide (TPR) repeat protein